MHDLDFDIFVTGKLHSNYQLSRHKTCVLLIKTMEYYIRATGNQRLKLVFRRIVLS